MPKHATATSAGIVEGRIDKLRVAVPVQRGNIHLRVDGVPVVGVVEDAAITHTLRTVHERGVPARVGVLIDGQGMRHFSWLAAPGGLGVAPRYYHDERHRAWRHIAMGTGVVAVSLAAAWMLGVQTFPRVLLMTLALTVALIALLLSGLSTHGLWHNRSHRSAILQSEQQYRQCLQAHPDLAPAPEAGPRQTGPRMAGPRMAGPRIAGPRQADPHQADSRPPGRPASPRRGKRHGR